MLVLVYLFQIFTSLTLVSSLTRGRSNGYNVDFQHNFVEIDQVNYHYVSLGSNKKPLMLLCHGFPEAWFTFEHQMRYFSTNYFVVSMDMLGYGLTDNPKDLNRFGFASLSYDIDRIVSHLNKTEVEVMVGHNWGAHLAYQFKRFYPKRVNKIVAIASTYQPIPYVNSTLLNFETKVSKVVGLGYQVNLANLDNVAYYDSHLQLLLNAFWSYDYSSLQNSILNVAANSTAQQLLQVVDLDNPKLHKFGPKPNSKFLVDLKNYYQRNSILGPTNWYRTQSLAFQQLMPTDLLSQNINSPILLIFGKLDFAVAQLRSFNLSLVNDFSLKFVEDGNHFVHFNRPETTNQIINGWLKSFF